MTAGGEEIVEEHIEVGNSATRVLRAGRSGPTLVLLHGFGDSADSWRPLLEHLPLHALTVVAPDLPGFGHASRLERTAVLPQWERFVGDLVNQLARPSSPVILGGNSLGGLLTLRMALQGTVAAAIPIAPGGVMGPSWWAPWLTHAARLRRVLAAPVPWPHWLVDPTLTRSLLTFGFHEPGRLDPAVTSHLLAQLHDRRSLRRLIAVGASLAREVATAGHMALETIECPTLVIWGLEDKVLSPRGAEHLKQTLAEVDVVCLDRCGHCPQVEQPEAVGRAISDFLARRGFLRTGVLTQ